MNNRDPFVYKTNDHGKTWRMITNGLGDIAILEKGEKTVLFSDREGKVLGKLTGKGPGYELSDPVDIVFDSLDQLYILW